MKFFKNIEVSRLFGINATTVTNYINGALSGKNNLQLFKKEDRHFIIDNQYNRSLIEEMAEEGRKYKSKDLIKTVSPKKEFYEIFNPAQIAEIITSLEVYHEIPNKFAYMNDGAKSWHEYTQTSFKEKLSNPITTASQMLMFNLDFFINKLDTEGKREKFNIYDLGMGDMAPVNNILSALIEKDLLNKYTAIDMSNEMIEMAKENIKEKFANSFESLFINRDFNHETFQDVLFYDKNQKDGQFTRNLIIFVGSTIENQQDVSSTLLTIKNSLSKDDMVTIGHTVDTKSARVYFEQFKQQDQENSDFGASWIINLLRINAEDYKLKTFYDEKLNCRFLNLVLQTDLDIHFEDENISKKNFFRKGTEITVWRHWHHTVPELVNLLTELGFEVLHLITSKDQAQCLVTCQLA